MGRFSKAAEHYFAGLCTDNGAVCHPPDDDMNGWDLYVELPPEAHSGPVESAPGHRTALVQVKSTTGKGLSTSVKVSNLLKAAQDKRPWFIVLYRKSGSQVELFARHFWTELMETALRSSRQCDVDGIALNQKRVSVAFSVGDRVVGNMVDWMQAKIAESGADYEATKSRLFTELGYEDGHGTVKWTISASDKHDVFMEFLGLGNGLKVEQFEFVPSRFQIADPRRRVAATKGTVRITPHPVGQCTVTIKPRLQQGEPISLRAELYRLPSILGNDIARVSSPPIELTVEGNRVGLNVNVMRSTKLSLQQWVTYSQLNYWARNGGLELQIWQGGRKLKVNSFTYKGTESVDWKRVLDIVLALNKIAERACETEIAFSFADIVTGLGPLAYLQQGVAPYMKLESDDPDIPKIVDLMAYYSIAEVGGWTVAHIVTRKVRADSMNGEKRSIVAGAPELATTFVFRDASPEQRDSIVSAYKDFALELGEDQQVITFEELGTHVARMQKSTSYLGQSGD